MTYVIFVLTILLLLLSLYMLYSLITGELEMNHRRSGRGIFYLIFVGPVVLIAFFKRIRSILEKEPLIKFDDEGVHIFQWKGYDHYKWTELKDMTDEDSFNLVTVENEVVKLPSKMLDYSADEIMMLFYDRLYYYNKEE